MRLEPNGESAAQWGATAQERSGWAAHAQRLGEILVESGRITPAQLQEALEEQRRQPRRLGQILCELGYLEPAALTEALAQQAGLPRVDWESTSVDAEAARLINMELATKHRVLPYALVGERSLKLAMADPFDAAALEVVRVFTGRRIERAYCPEQELLEAVRKVYGSNVARMIADLGPPQDAADQSQPESVLELQELARQPSLVNLVNLIILEAAEARASDVHIEPFEKTLRVKYRIDGVLQEMPPPPRHLYAAIVSRIKIMAGMNIAERFVPQDGHFTFHTPRGALDVRVGTVPTVFGESVALRLLDRSAGLIDLDRIGFPQHAFKPYCLLLQKPHGIVLVTGPTGSGKTTTLYASLNHIFTPEKKIITIEDPVEYQLDGVNQIPVNRKRGLDFAGGLRAILRQDPDIIMVGEIRDRETADIAIRAALTGHLVFSTLHTNNAPGAVTRLIDMGVEPYLLAASLEGVVAQRLVRCICPACKEPHQPAPEVLERLGHRAAQASQTAFYRGRGCRQCRQTGYTKRIGVFELLVMTDAVRRVVQRGGTQTQIAAAAPDYQPMREHGYQLAVAGVTTLEEVIRVTQDSPAEEALGSD
ncbi:MAG TPA: GspE/PulE family protein [Phycisphaeraceae bacterium]